MSIEADRIRCVHCGTIILSSTAAKNLGLCKLCPKSARSLRDAMLLLIVFALMPILLCWFLEFETSEALRKNREVRGPWIVAAFYNGLGATGYRTLTLLISGSLGLLAVYFYRRWKRLKLEIYFSIAASDSGLDQQTNARQE